MQCSLVPRNQLVDESEGIHQIDLVCGGLHQRGQEIRGVGQEVLPQALYHAVKKRNDS